MSQVFHVLVTDQDTGEQNITVFVPGSEKPSYSAHNSHPNFAAIKEAASKGDPGVVELFDVAETVAARFEPLTDRISVANGRVYLDGDEIHNSLTAQVVRFIEEGVDDWIPLVSFFENVQANPEPHSREQLFEWLDRRNFSINFHGDLVAYKGVEKYVDGEGNTVYRSINSGVAIVDGEKVNGRVPNAIGSVIEIPRSLVHHDPSVGCSTGLHVGTHEYASGWARGALLKVTVNPRDVVSVPTDCNAAKVRVCRYFVEDVIEQEITSAFDSPFEDDEFEDEWGDHEYDPFE